MKKLPIRPHEVLGIIVAAALCASLSACATPLQASTTDKQKAAYEAACNLAHGDYNNAFTPTCLLTYTYPALPSIFPDPEDGTYPPALSLDK